MLIPRILLTLLPLALNASAAPSTTPFEGEWKGKGPGTNFFNGKLEAFECEAKLKVVRVNDEVSLESLETCKSQFQSFTNLPKKKVTVRGEELWCGTYRCGAVTATSFSFTEKPDINQQAETLFLVLEKDGLEYRHLSDGQFGDNPAFNIRRRMQVHTVHP